MKDFWDGIGTSNATGPSSYRGQTAGYYTGGNLFLRTRAMNAQLASIQLPDYRAGCGGIDFFAGGFSFINSDQLVALMRAIGTNAVSYAFKLALETISPMIAEQIGELQKLIQEINQFNINSCETAKGFVDSLWPQADKTSRVLCEDLGNSSGAFTDRAAAKNGCSSGGKRADTLKKATGEMKEQRVEDSNIAWKAIQKNSLLSGDKGLAELVMNVSGTIVITAPKDDKTPVTFAYFSHKGDDSALIEALLKGGTVTLNTCIDKTECLKINRSGTLTVKQARSFSGRVRTLLTSMQGKIDTDAALSKAEIALLNATSLPLYKIINVQTAWRGSLSALELPQYADLVALDILYRYLSDLLGEIEKGGDRLALASKDLLAQWKGEVQAARAALLARTTQVSHNFTRLVNVVDSVRVLEQQLAGKLSAGMRATLAFTGGDYQ